MHSLTDRAWCLQQKNTLYCQPAKEGGYGIWDRGSAVRWAHGNSEEEAWRNCRINISAKARDRLLRGKNDSIADAMRDVISEKSEE